MEMLLEKAWLGLKKKRLENTGLEHQDWCFEATQWHFILRMYFKNKGNREKDIWSALQIGQMSQICISYLGTIKQHDNKEFHALLDS